MKIKDTMPKLHGKLGVIHAIASTSHQVQRGAEPKFRWQKNSKKPTGLSVDSAKSCLMGFSHHVGMKKSNLMRENWFKS